MVPDSDRLWRMDSTTGPTLMSAERRLMEIKQIANTSSNFERMVPSG